MVLWYMYNTVQIIDCVYGIMVHIQYCTDYRLCIWYYGTCIAFVSCHLFKYEV
jgi:hypothetical protein